MDNLRIRDMNNKGQMLVTADIDTSESFYHLYLPDSAYGLAPGTHGLISLNHPFSMEANSLNDSGIVAGISSIKHGDSIVPTKWYPGQAPIGYEVFGPNTVNKNLYPYDINNAGLMVGGIEPNMSGRFATFPYRFDGLQYDSLDYLVCDGSIRVGSSFIDINDNGDIAARVHCGPLSGAVFHDLAIWRAPNYEIQKIDIGEDGFSWGYKAFNNAGQILGIVQYAIDSNIVAIIEPDGQVTLIHPPDPTTYLYANDMNDAGEVVGYVLFVDSVSNTECQFSYYAFLWLPNDAYGLLSGLHNLREIVKDDPLINIDNGFLAEALTINNSGQIGGVKWVTECVYEEGEEGEEGDWLLSRTKTSFLLTPTAKIGLIVNSTGDESDKNPGDGFCSTENGECTMRAAIEEANALAGADLIKFNIPGAGIPVIKPTTELPHITEAVTIVGSTQPNSGQVELNGSLLPQLTSIDGLTIEAGGCDISGLIIDQFPDDGLVLMNGDGNKIHSNLIGSLEDPTGINGNGGHGIYIKNSSKNIIGDGNFSNPKDNFIANNGGAGIYVESGVENKIRRNSIFNNGGLGIDLAPLGVNANDSLDMDIGANNKTNYPIIFDATAFPSTIYVVGKIIGKPNQTYSVDFYLSDNCDESYYGEGKTYFGSTIKTTNNEGTKNFFESIALILVTVPENYTVSATTTLLDGEFANSTSEFSNCWPNKKLKIVDANGAPLSLKKFALSHISNNAPLHSDTLIDTIITDDMGYLDLTDMYRNDILEYEDTIMLSQILHTEYTVKHPTVVNNAYYVLLDNAKFDSMGVMSYDVLDESVEQVIVMDHTTINYSLLVSLEWDADLAYIESLQDGFRLMSNYMYDVSDGQIRFDSIAIFDNSDEWNFADIQIYASNNIGPHVDRVGGLFNDFGETADPMEMPRKWFGSKSKSHNGTFNEHPLDMTFDKTYRTFAHEFGHYALFLDDEYKIIDGEVRCKDRERYVKPYGFMDSHYSSSGEYSSELSSSFAYSDTLCQNNRHWATYGRSTWHTFDSIYEKSYNGIFSPIIRPTERALKEGLDYIPGPNNDMNNLDYDVGALVIFPISHTAPSAVSLKVRFYNEANPNSLVLTGQNLTLLDTVGNLAVRNLDQGFTSDDGGMWIVGKFPEHYILTVGYSQILVGTGGNALSIGGGRTWLYGGTIVEYADSLVIGMREVQGDKSVISQVQLGSTGFTYNLETPNLFLSVPTIEHIPDGGSITKNDFNIESNGYGVSITDSVYSSGLFRLTATDDSGAVYTFDADYSTSEIDTGVVSEIKGPRGVSEVSIDNTSNSIKRVMILSTDYPVLRAGLLPTALQGGPAQNLALFPELPLNGNNEITIHYSDADVSDGSKSINLEETLRIFHWDEAAHQWVFVGGTVDTSFNEVTSQIASAGVYAAFTTDITTGVGDNDGDHPSLPDRIQLNQNYPNPFNPSTSISFVLPKASEVKLEIFNLLGQVVTTIHQGRLAAGYHKFDWDGSNVSSGIYLYRLTAGDFVESKKMLLLK